MRLTPETMRMTSKERVLTAFEHKEPDRVPCWCGSSAEFWAKAKRALQLDDDGLRLRFRDDFRRVWPRYCGPRFKLSPGAHTRTPSGVEHAGLGYGQPASHPLAHATFKDVEAYTWPDPMWQDVSRIRGDALAWKGEYVVLFACRSPRIRVSRQRHFDATFTSL
jgi:uroporphyrinogen decarboxylase